MSPTQRSKQELIDKGYHVEKVEYYNSFSRRMKDLWGFIDLLAIKKGEVLAVQVTGGMNNKPSHIKKMNENELLPLVKSSGIKVELHTWRKLIVGKYKNGNPKKGWVNDIVKL